MKTNNLTTKRFVIRKSLIGENTVITFTNKKIKHLLMIMTKYTHYFKKSSSQCLAFKSMEVTQIVILYQNSVEN